MSEGSISSKGIIMSFLSKFNGLRLLSTGIGVPDSKYLVMTPRLGEGLFIEKFLKSGESLANFNPTEFFSSTPLFESEE